MDVALPGLNGLGRRSGDSHAADARSDRRGEFQCDAGGPGAGDRRRMRRVRRQTDRRHVPRRAGRRLWSTAMTEPRGCRRRQPGSHPHRRRRAVQRRLPRTGAGGPRLRDGVRGERAGSARTRRRLPAGPRPARRDDAGAGRDRHAADPQGRSRTRLIPVVLMTALNSVEDRVRGIEAGADDFLSKPVDDRELLARIRRRSPQTSDRRDSRRASDYERHPPGAVRKAAVRCRCPRRRVAARGSGDSRGCDRLPQPAPTRARQRHHRRIRRVRHR